MAKKHVTGHIPRTLSAARTAGLEPIEFSYAGLTRKEKRTFIQLSDVGARAGVICGVVQTSQGPMVCYKDANGLCTWVPSPRAAFVDDHA